MKHAIVHTKETLKISYEWQLRNESLNSLSVTASPYLKNIEAGSEEEFIFEHYFGFNMLNNTTTIEYTVEHPRWQVHPVSNSKLIADIEILYGKAFVPYISDKKLRSAFLAQGSDVRVKTLKKLRKDAS
jgi:hypothetical protein